MVLALRKPSVIAITGSVGKTGTKDAVTHLLTQLSTPGSVRGSRKSFNSEIGIPLTILGLPNAWSNPLLWLINLMRGLVPLIPFTPYPSTLVLELGADHPGDIARAAAILEPDIAILTRLPDVPVHVEYFDGPEAVRKEKASLLTFLKKSGIFIGNDDDPYIPELRTKTGARYLSYGFGASAVIRATRCDVWYRSEDGIEVPHGMEFRIDRSGGSFPIRIVGVIGTPVVSAALAAITVGIAKGASMVDIASAFSTFIPPPGRLRIHPGIHGSVIIDDSYNSSPVAAEEALTTLSALSVSGRRVAILGDMLELGEWSEREHLRIGDIAARSVDLLLTVGRRAEKDIVAGAMRGGLSQEKIVSFETSEDAGAWLATRLRPGDVVLGKGSQGRGKDMIRIERALKKILRNPDDARLLVRQEGEWSAR